MNTSLPIKLVRTTGDTCNRLEDSRQKVVSGK